MPEADPPEPAPSEAAPEPRTVIIGVISAPGTSTELAERLRPDLVDTAIGRTDQDVAGANVNWCN